MSSSSPQPIASHPPRRLEGVVSWYSRSQEDAKQTRPWRTLAPVRLNRDDCRSLLCVHTKSLGILVVACDLSRWSQNIPLPHASSSFYFHNNVTVHYTALLTFLHELLHLRHSSICYRSQQLAVKRLIMYHLPGCRHA